MLAELLGASTGAVVLAAYCVTILCATNGQLLGHCHALNLDYQFKLVQAPAPAGSPEKEAHVTFGPLASGEEVRRYPQVFVREAPTFTLKVPALSMPGENDAILLRAIRGVLIEALPQAAREIATAGRRA